MAMRVGELARRTGVGVSTLRAWENRYHFLSPERSAAGHRLYAESDVERVDAVVRLVAEGLTLPAAITRVASVGSGALPDGEAEALLFRQILQCADQGFWVAKDGRTRYANRRMAEIMATTVDVLLATPVLEFFKPEDVPVIRQRTEHVRAGNRLHQTIELRRPDGTTFLAEITTTPLLNPAGRYDGAVALVNDITDRHETEAHARLRATLLDAVGEAVLAATPDSKVTYVNRAAERLFGWRVAELIGRDGLRTFPAPVDAEKAERIHRSLLAGRRYAGRLTMSRRDGTQFVAHMAAEPAVDDDGTLVGLVSVFSDLTERDQLDRDLRTRELQAETLGLLGAQALRQRTDLQVAATLIVTEAVEATRRLLDADHTSVLDVVADTNELHLRAASPNSDESIVLPPGSRSFAGYITLARKAVLVDDTAHDPRFEGSIARSGELTSSAIGAPIFGPDGILGVLIAERSTANSFDQGDAHFIQSMANIIGTAILK
jgi:PAS domain S-box-containing protein